MAVTGLLQYEGPQIDISGITNTIASSQKRRALEAQQAKDNADRAVRLQMTKDAAVAQAAQNKAMLDLKQQGLTAQTTQYGLINQFNSEEAKRRAKEAERRHELALLTKNATLNASNSTIAKNNYSLKVLKDEQAFQTALLEGDASGFNLDGTKLETVPDTNAKTDLYGNIAGIAGNLPYQEDVIAALKTKLKAAGAKPTKAEYRPLEFNDKLGEWTGSDTDTVSTMNKYQKVLTPETKHPFSQVLDHTLLTKNLPGKTFYQASMDLINIAKDGPEKFQERNRLNNIKNEEARTNTAADMQKLFELQKAKEADMKSDDSYASLKSRLTDAENTYKANLVNLTNLTDKFGSKYTNAVNQIKELPGTPAYKVAEDKVAETLMYNDTVEKESKYSKQQLLDEVEVAKQKIKAQYPVGDPNRRAGLTLINKERDDILAKIAINVANKVEQQNTLFKAKVDLDANTILETKKGEFRVAAAAILAKAKSGGNLDALKARKLIGEIAHQKFKDIDYEPSETEYELLIKEMLGKYVN